jgi:hypothetical protein
LEDYLKAHYAAVVAEVDKVLSMGQVDFEREVALHIECLNALGEQGYMAECSRKAAEYVEALSALE